MKRWIASLVLALLVMTVAPSVATAGPRQVVRAYEGTTSAGGRIVLFTKVRDGVVRFLAVELEDVATCGDGTTPSFVHGLDYGPRGLPLPDGALTLEARGFSDAFFVSGTLGTKQGSGTITHLFAALDPQEDPMLCTTEELTWTVDRVIDETVVRTEGPLIRERAGGVTETAELPGATRSTTEAPLRERLRHYEGRTSQRHPMFFITAKRPEAVVLHELGVAWDLACEDASEISLGFFILFAGEPLEQGRVDYDSVAPEIALHVNGSLGAHLGSGTTSIVIPALTEDLAAQACRSGALTWRAWRVDEGS